MGTKTVVSTEGPGYCPLGEVLLIPGSAGADPGFFEGGGGGLCPEVGQLGVVGIGEHSEPLQLSVLGW